MVTIPDPKPKALAAARTFLAESRFDSPSVDTNLGSKNLAKNTPVEEKKAAALAPLQQELANQLRDAGAAKTFDAIDRARHSRFVLIMFVAVLFLIAVVAISFFARESVALALFGSGGVCVVFIGFLRSALKEQMEWYRLDTDAHLVDTFRRILGLVRDADDAIRITETFENVLAQRARLSKEA